MARLPRVGVTVNTDPAYAGYQLRRDYCACLLAAGLLPLLLPHLRPDLAPSVLDGLEGLLVSGGGDYPPQTYGQGPFLPPTDRDQWELALIQNAWERGLPILGVCRGCQGLNIALGGDLIPDLASREGGPCHQQTQPRRQPSHWVHLTHPELTRRYGRERIRVNSFHHQAVDRLGPGLMCAAKSPEGITEAVCSHLPGRFALGVQWHPEALPDLVPFQALAESAFAYGGTKP